MREFKRQVKKKKTRGPKKYMHKNMWTERKKKRGKINNHNDVKRKRVLKWRKKSAAFAKHIKVKKT